MDSVIAQSLAAVAVVKPVVDLIKLAVPRSPEWLPPMLALLLGPAVVALLMVAAGELMTQQLWAQAILAGLLAGAGAVGTTELGKRASTSVYMKVGEK